ncbi:MAG: PEP-CTERM sorting domain-containing protein [Spirulina sp.]
MKTLLRFGLAAPIAGLMLASLATSAEAGTLIGETGSISDLNHLTQEILFKNEYINPVVFVGPPSFNGNQPASARLNNVSSTGFDINLEEPDDMDGLHTLETLSYLVLESGSWALDDGGLLQVGSLNAGGLVGTNSDDSGWNNVDFAFDFANDPLLFSQVQTSHEDGYLVTRHDNVGTTGFSIGMQEGERSNNSGHLSETIGWFALESGSGDWSGNTYQAGQTGDRVTHDWANINFTEDFENIPAILAAMADFDGPNTAGLRYQNASEGGVQIKVEEETSLDPEINHTTETVNYLAIEGDKNLEGDKIISPKEIPDGQTVKYRISQETVAGEGDFDDNILGFIDAFATDGTLEEFYGYNTDNRYSFGNSVDLTEDMSHLFLVQGSDGLGLFSVHDKYTTGRQGGGVADMQFDLFGDTASFLVKDDPGDQSYTETNSFLGGTLQSTLTSKHKWWDCCTDGSAIGYLDGLWEMFAQFTDFGANDGGMLEEWAVLSGDGSAIDVVLQTGRRVRIDVVVDRPTQVPEPASLLGLLTVGALGTSLRKRQEKES